MMPDGAWSSLVAHAMPGIWNVSSEKVRKSYRGGQREMPRAPQWLHGEPTVTYEGGGEATGMEGERRAGEKSGQAQVPGLDALILSSLIDAGCIEIYTTDSHFEAYKKRGVRIINLECS